jgi:hypothetical protein
VADRAEYAARQAALLEALMRGDGYPAGFDSDRAGRAGSSLRRKRARAVRSAWPGLSAGLGPDFEARFDAFVRATGPPASDGGLVDGLAFVDWLGPGEDAALTEPVRVELLLARAAVRRRRGTDGFVRRRGAFVGAARLGDPPRLIVVIQAPGVGRRVGSVPLPRTGRPRAAAATDGPEIDEAAG